MSHWEEYEESVDEESQNSQYEEDGDDWSFQEEQSEEYLSEEESEDGEAPEVLFEGWLEKKTEFHHNWKKRWFVLQQGGPLFYYDKQQDVEPAGVIYLQNARVTEKAFKNGSEQPLWFIVRSSDKKDFLFQSPTQDDKEKWCKYIKECAMESHDVSKEEKKSKLMGIVFSNTSGSFFFTGRAPLYRKGSPTANNTAKNSRSQKKHVRARVVPRQVYQEEEEEEEEDDFEADEVAVQAPLRRYSAPTPDGKEEVKRG